MTLEFLKRAIEGYKLLYANEVDEPERTIECNNCDKALAEIAEVIERVKPNDYFGGSCTVVSTDTIIDLLNIATYDVYGKLYAKYNGNVTFDMYATVVHKGYFIPGVSTAALKDGYDVIHDLYGDNEREGNHNPDGTFKYSG